MQRMTEAAVRDSEAMKQISYLTMIFLPATFVAVRSALVLVVK
jgi:Mg2+ and Co2+ transporter CorA